MKVLVAAGSYYNDNLSMFKKNRTGLGFMINDIIKSGSKYNEMFFLSKIITKRQIVNEDSISYEIVSHTWRNIFLNIKIQDIIQGLKWFFKYDQKIMGRLKYFYYCIDKGYVRKVIKKLSPDIVHIHSIGQESRPYIEVCEELKIPYLVTLHGLIGLDESVNAPKWSKEYEREFLIKSDVEHIPVSVISSGMKKRIEANYLNHESTSISVITNGTKINKHYLNEIVDLRSQCHIPNEGKIMVVVGNVCERKNQIQIVEALSLLPEKVKKNTFLIICGQDYTDGMMEDLVKKYQLEKNVILMGFVDRNYISHIYSQADINITASRDEGFGLSIIEGFTFGLPTIAFSDLDVIQDLYDPKAMMLCHTRESSDLAKTIISASEYKWDVEYIKKYANHFSLEKMSEEYLNQYKSILERGGFR